METQERYKEKEKAVEQKHANGNATTAQQHHHMDDDEIDLTTFFKEVWKRKKILLYTLTVALLIGVFAAIVSPEEYTANIVLMPQSETNSVGGSSNILRQIGGFTGVNFGASNTGLDKTLYPDITKSTLFTISVMEEEQYFPSLDTTMSLYHYFTEISEPPLTESLKKYTIGLPAMLINLPLAVVNMFKTDTAPSSENMQKGLNSINREALEKDTSNNDSVNEYEPITLNKKQIRVMSLLRNRITTTIEKNGTVTVSAAMPDPLVAAKTTELAVSYLTRYITEYRTEKVQKDLNFIEKQFKEKEDRYNKAQQRLASLRDRNLNIVTESARIALQQTQTEYDLSYSLYQGIAQQLEQARIKVQEETPVFKVLEPIQIPLSTSEPNRELIIILSLFAGTAIGFGLIVMQIIISNIKSKF